MINKSKLWFLTLSSIILVLAIYYVAIPYDNTSLVFKDSANNNTDIQIEESEVLTAMRVNKEESRLESISTLQDALLDTNKSINEKNEAYEQIQYLNANNTLEEKIEKLILKDYKINSFVEIDDNRLKIVIANYKHDYNFASKLISFINVNTNNEYYVTVKFE